MYEKRIPSIHPEVSSKQLHLLKIPGSFAQGQFLPTKVPGKWKSRVHWSKVAVTATGKRGTSKRAYYSDFQNLKPDTTASGAPDSVSHGASALAPVPLHRVQVTS